MYLYFVVADLYATISSRQQGTIIISIEDRDIRSLTNLVQTFRHRQEREREGSAE